jgi:nitroreductase
MELMETILTRRSIRSYDERPIPEDILKQVLDAARNAPSGSNREPTRLVVVQDAQRRDALAQLCSHQKFVGQAPVVVAVVVKSIAWNRGNFMGEYSSLVDGAIVLDHLTLAARNFDLGTCWIGAFDNDQVKDFLQIPEGWNVVGLTPIGYPAKVHAFTTTDKRMAYHDFVMQEQWKA